MSSPKVRASLDLGTNTCLMLVVSGVAGNGAGKGGFAEVVSDHSTVVRLGQDVDRTRKLHPEAVERTLACLRDYASVLRAAGGEPSEAVAVSTATARDASNGAEFFARVEKETGFRFKVISGDDEARFTFLGALLPGMEAASSAVIDIGGGSTELITEGGQGKSLDLGSVRFTERYLKSDPVTDPEFWACQDAIDAMFETMRPWRAGLAADTRLVAVAGTATTLAAWQLGLERFEARAIDEVTLTRGDVHRMVEELKWRSVAERCGLAGMEQKRADVILAGALILWRAMEVLGFAEARISTRGLRYGVLASG
jgi:exopolyphosphatase/guanosine-5'-triphosphate,3'-diphosphate pyrophosphatase